MVGTRYPATLRRGLHISQNNRYQYFQEYHTSSGFWRRGQGSHLRHFSLRSSHIPPSIFHNLCHELAYRFIYSNRDLERPSKHLVRALKSREPEEDLYERYNMDDYVNEGYCKWKDHAASEKMATENFALERLLFESIRKTPKVQFVSITSNPWNENYSREQTVCRVVDSGPPSIRE